MTISVPPPGAEHPRPPPLTFARFVPLPENRAGLLAVQRVAACVASGRTRRAVNPLYLFGPPGTGKTHLVHALVAEVSRRVPGVAAAVLSAAEIAPPRAFGAESAPPDGLPDPRQTDLVAVEDVQHLPARAAEPLVGLLDECQARQAQVVMTATAGPRQLDLPARLTSRLGAGLLVGVEPLGEASRRTLLEDKAQRRQLAVSRDVLAWLAAHLTGGGRQLDGALARLEALTRSRRRAPDLAAVAELFRAEAETSRPTVERIAERVSGHFRVDRRQLVSGRRSRSVLLPRQVGMYLARQMTGLSLDQIGAYFGGRDHSTVLHACRKVEQALGQDAALSGSIRQLQADLR